MSIHTLYPIQSDINNVYEKDSPEYYNYVTLRGKQIFLIKNRQKKYEVLTSGWTPNPIQYEILIKNRQTNIYGQFSHYQDALDLFYKLTRELWIQSSKWGS